MNAGTWNRERFDAALAAAGVMASEVQEVDASLEDVFIEQVASDGSGTGVRS